MIEKRRAVYDEVATTIITACELYYGAAKSLKPTDGKRAVDSFPRSSPSLISSNSASSFGSSAAFRLSLEPKEPSGATELDNATRWAKPDRAGPRGSQMRLS